MFQTFDETANPDDGPARLDALRQAMAIEGVDAFLVPLADVYQGEYVAPRDARLAWLTGFTGSAGFAAVLADVAGVFIDGRYRLQVRDQVADVFTPVHWPEVKLAGWLNEQMPDGGVMGYDPWLHTISEIRSSEKSLANTGITLRAMDNLIDPLWTDQPDAPRQPFTAYPIENAGESHADKRARLSAEISDGCTLLTQPDSIAWLLNIRGTDTERNPVPQAFALLHHDGAVTLYALPGKADGITDHFGPHVSVVDQTIFADHLTQQSGPIRVDPKTCPQAVKTLLGDKVVEGSDPCALPKARKNPTEIAGSRAAHMRDGAAMVQFLAWLDAEAPKGGLTEIDVVKRLESFRRDTNALRDISFETISGAGPNGAIVHYRVTEATNRAVNVGELLLVDSGGQYIDGTTDITRTITIGTPPEDAIASYTAVLRGMVNLSRTRFPKGHAGRDLDAIARQPLWDMGRDFDHGTGHGVGAYLSVHEGPQGISRRNTVPLEPGMILSNEPGYYREGAFGIRIENLIVVEAADDLPTADDREMYQFETLTFVPFDRRLIDVGQLTDAERGWIDAYHRTTLDKIGGRVEGAALAWLQQACAPL